MTRLSPATVGDERLAAQVLQESGPKVDAVDCGCFDRETRKALLYLVKVHQDLRKRVPSLLKHDGDLLWLKEALEDCKFKGRKNGKGRNSRSEWMGQCMRSPQKGGRGRSMAECAVEWKEKKNEETTPQQGDGGLPKAQSEGAT